MAKAPSMYVATQNILFDGVLAYAKGDPVHPDNVKLYNLKDLVEPAPAPEPETETKGE